jgi:hypothetical protein
MRLLALEAGRQGWTVYSLAKKCEREIHAFVRSFESLRPQYNGVARLVRELGLPPIIARALLGKLTDDDLGEIQGAISGEIAVRRRGTFVNSSAAALGFLEAMRLLDATTKRAVYRAYVLANAGLDEEPADAVLGPTLGAVERVLAATHGFSLRPFVADPDFIVERKREAISWFLLLREACELSANDEARVGRVIGPYLAGADDIARHDVESKAREKAKRAYRQMIKAGVDIDNSNDENDFPGEGKAQ